MMDFRYNGCFLADAPCLNGGHSYSFASCMGHPRSNSIVLLVYDGMHTISEASVLHYKSLGIALTPLGMCYYLRYTI
jgi:hypothetical protein